MQEVLSLDAMSQSRLVKAGEVKPAELVEAAISRIEALNPRLNAVISKMYDQAREQAKQPPADAPFAGVPFLMKDLEPFGGATLTAGSAFLRDFVVPADSAYAARLRRAGFITLGKTNLPELGMQMTTEPELFGPTYNPWNLDHSPGGSSGGAAAAVAAGMVAVAQGGDLAGSIRGPASCCGLFGLKPSRGRLPRNPDLTFGYAVNHCLSRSVRDSAALLDATAGSGGGDSFVAPPPERPFLEEASSDPGKLRIAFTTRTLRGNAVHPDCVAAVEEAATLCADLGHTVEEDTFALDAERFLNDFLTIAASGAAATINTLAYLSGQTPAAEHFEPYTWALAQLGWQTSATDYLQRLAAMQMLAGGMAQFLSKYDLWLTPTLATPPIRTGDLPHTGDLTDTAHRVFDWYAFTPLANATGLPAMSVPLHWNNDGLPVGVHFIGRYGDEKTLFRLAGQLEQARPWAGRRPPIVEA